MLDIKEIRENPELIKEGAKAKRIKCDIDRILEIDQKVRPLRQEIEKIQHERNSKSKTIAKCSADERQTLIGEVSKLKETLNKLENKLDPLSEELKELLLFVPQPARSDVPVGKDDSENIELKTWGKPPSFDFEIKDHMDLANNLIDVERGVKLAGSRSYLLKGDVARLEHAVMRLVYDKLISKEYTPISVPVLVNESCMVGTGYFPTGRDQAYVVEKDELTLIGTSEVALTSIYKDEIVSDLPKRLMAQSSCFRREAGTYGKDTHGLYRVHQFQKIEQVIICQNDEKISERMHDELLNNAEEILQDLELPYRVVYVCSGDLGQGQVRKHDIETWMPSRNAYSETHSCSTFYEFQARRLMLRYRTSDGETKYCHTLNNTAIASPRVLIPLLENHQQKDGSIKIPKALQKYMGNKEIIKP